MDLLRRLMVSVGLREAPNTASVVKDRLQSVLVAQRAELSRTHPGAYRHIPSPLNPSTPAPPPTPAPALSALPTEMQVGAMRGVGTATARALDAHRVHTVGALASLGDASCEEIKKSVRNIYALRRRAQEQLRGQ